MPITASASDGTSSAEDLAGVLQHVALDKLAINRPRIANSPDTRRFLELGLQILREDFIGFEAADIDGLDRCRLFESISLARLLQQAEKDDADEVHPAVLTHAKFRERWRHKNRYTEDLIAYLFRTGPQLAYLDEVNLFMEELIRTVPFRELVRRLAAAEIEMVLADPLFGLHAIVEVALPNHARVREFLRDQEEVLLPGWAGIYERIASAYGLGLADRYTWLDIAKLFNTVINGMLTAARSTGGQPPLLSSGDDVLTGAIFAMLPTIFDVRSSDVNALYAKTPGTA